MLQPGYCYTFLGQGLPQVAEVDLQVSIDLSTGLPPALSNMQLKPVLAVDSTTGPNATIGAKKECFKWPWPIPGAVKLEVKARMGSGPVFAQAYKKKG